MPKQTRNDTEKKRPRQRAKKRPSRLKSKQSQNRPPKRKTPQKKANAAQNRSMQIRFYLIWRI